jgi:hypothetical protein
MKLFRANLRYADGPCLKQGRYRLRKFPDLTQRFREEPNGLVEFFMRN